MIYFECNFLLLKIKKINLRSKSFCGAFLYQQKILLFTEVSNKSNERLCRTNNSPIASPLHVLIPNGVAADNNSLPYVRAPLAQQLGAVYPVIHSPYGKLSCVIVSFRDRHQGSRERQNEATGSPVWKSTKGAVDFLLTSLVWFVTHGTRI